jgi:uracil-DNA glycosylase
MSEQAALAAPAAHTPLPPFAATAGPRKAKIVLLGEAWGEGEVSCRQPFVGESGKELWRMLGEAWPEAEPDLHRKATQMHKYGYAWVKDRAQWLEAVGVAFTNVLALRPPGNNLEALCGTKQEVGGTGYILPPITKGKYLRPEYLPELDRLSMEIRTMRPNLLIACGNTACWALLQATNIGSIRGAITSSTPSGPGSGIKCLPTYHPAGVLRQWAWRPIVVADLMKAQREAQFPEIRRPERTVLVDPTIEEVEKWTRETLQGQWFRLAPDIETFGGQIKCIGFARSRAEALVVPFIDKRKKGWSYWPTAQEELRAWKCVEQLLASGLDKVGQNFLYDLQYICRLGLRPKRLKDDTMLLHHSLFPELQKGLGFLGSIYTNEASWKLMRRQKADTEKRDE